MKINVKKEKADKGVNKSDNVAGRSPEVPAFINIAKVLTTVSLDINPVTSAVDALQSPNPNGLKIGAMILPSIASMLSALSAT